MASGSAQEGAECGGGVVTVLYYDGNVLQFPQRIKCSELLASFPWHAICPANALLLKQEGKMLPGEFFLELGHMYFLVPKPGDHASVSTAGPAHNVPQFPMRFKISREYLARILTEGGFRLSVAIGSPRLGIVEKEPTTPPEELVSDYDESRCLDPDGAEAECNHTRDNTGADSEEQGGLGGGGGRECPTSTSVVTLLHYDGKVLEYPERILCSEVLASFPAHAVCPATALVSKQQGKMLQRNSFLEPGRTYFLVPRSGNVPSARSAEMLPRSSMRFKISKEYLARILEEGGVAASDDGTVSARRIVRTDTAFREQMLRLRRPASKASWVSSLDSIPEVVPA